MIHWKASALHRAFFESSALILVLFICCSCGPLSNFTGRSESTKTAGQPKLEQSGTPGTVAAEQSQVNGAAVAAASVRVAQQLLPIGLMTLTTQDVERRCMVSVIGEGTAVTAGHCFAGIPSQSGQVSCPAQHKIEWLVSAESGVFRLSNESSKCLTFELAHIDGDDGNEFALLRVEKSAVWPERRITFDRQAEFETSGPFKILGPISNQGVLSFIDPVSTNAFDVNDNSFLMGGTYQPGFSGAPVFRVSLVQSAIDFSSPAVGIYLGRGFGGSRVLRPKAFEKIIESLR